jgi:hypothetical protein
MLILSVSEGYQRPGPLSIQTALLFPYDTIMRDISGPFRVESVCTSWPVASYRQRAEILGLRSPSDSMSRLTILFCSVGVGAIP